MLDGCLALDSGKIIIQGIVETDQAFLDADGRSQGDIGHADRIDVETRRSIDAPCPCPVMMETVVSFLHDTVILHDHKGCT